ncbi:MAG TPA: hypothetical protein VKB94_08210 [Rhizomicrobium sp.]|nr:hypothetical protein [Rhizomicrobium sp.]
MTKRRKRELSGKLEVGGYPLRWSLKSEQIWDPKGEHVGLRLSVEREDESHRELVLEYPFREGGRIERPDIDRDRLGQDIRRAMDAGWNPKSRGRPFHFQL